MRRQHVELDRRCLAQGAESELLVGWELVVRQPEGRLDAAVPDAQFAESVFVARHAAHQVLHRPGAAVLQPGPGDAQGQRQPVAQPDQPARRLRLAARALLPDDVRDQQHRTPAPQRLQRDPSVGVQFGQPSAAGHQHAASRPCGQQRSHLVGVQDVVQHEEQP